MSLLDASTQQPIEGVHIFVHQTQIYTVSDEAGNADLAQTDYGDQEIVFYHPAYAITIFNYNETKNWNKNQSIFLTERTTPADETYDIKFESRKWKRSIKDFKNNLLGEDYVAKKCALINPEVLEFKRKEGILQTRATDILRIWNPILEYEMSVAIDQVEMTRQDIDYKGFMYFVDREVGGADSKVKDQREEVYLKSRRAFFKLLQLDILDEHKIKIRICRFENNTCETILEPKLKDLVEKEKDHYQLYFPEFLEVVHQNIRNLSENDQPTFGGGPLGQRFDNTYRIERVNVQYATTYFYNLGTSLQFNNQGRILNPEKVKIYGYWTRPRLGATVPLDFQ